MAIGEFGGAPAVPGDERRIAVAAPLYWFYEMSHAALNPARAWADATRLFFKNPVNPLSLTTFGKIDRRGRRIVRALDAPLRPAGMAHHLDAGRRRARAGAASRRSGSGRSAGSCISSACSSIAAPAAAEAADRRADVGPLRDAAARHGRGVPAQPRRLHHRLGRRAHGAAGGRPLRSRRLHRLRDLDPARARRRHPCHRGVPAVGAGAGRGRADGSRRRSLRAALHDADGRPDRHARQSDRASTSSPKSAASTGSAATSSPRCRFPIRASCATSIRASCS